MFGLMRPEKKCGKSCHQWTKTHRMHYCGTCKAIGNQYGHQARLFLNFDIVFLSELLSDLNQEVFSEWTDAYQAVNQCLTMPTEADKTPFSLQYTAAANTILSALKIDDNIKDQKKARWYLLRQFYNRSFRKAFEQMEAWGLSKATLFHWIDLQVEREQKLQPAVDDLMEHLCFYAEPTAELTALIFEYGVATIRPEQRKTFRALGYHFGLLNYILDAFEDLEEDIFTRQFNPLIHWYQAKKTLQQAQLVEVRQVILQLQHEICQYLEALPLQDSKIYQSRLVSNLALRIYRDRYIPTTFKERVALRWNQAKDVAATIICEPSSLGSMLQYYIIASSIFLVPAVAQQMPKQNNQILWDWSTFWSTISPFASQPVGTNPTPSSSTSTTKEDDERKERILCCCAGCSAMLPAFIIGCSACRACKQPSPSRFNGGGGGSSSCDCCNNQNCCNCQTNDCCCNNAEGDCCFYGPNGRCCCDNCCDNCECHNSNGQCCCDNGGGGGGKCCCDGNGGSGGGGKCCCDDNGGGGGGGKCCCDGNGGGGGGGKCCCDGNGGGGGGGKCCCDGNGGGGGGGKCCCDGNGGGGGGKCCCDGGGGGGGCQCCKAQVNEMEWCSNANIESCNGLWECFFPWHL